MIHGVLQITHPEMLFYGVYFFFKLMLWTIKSHIYKFSKKVSTVLATSVCFLSCFELWGLETWKQMKLLSSEFCPQFYRGGT